MIAKSTVEVRARIEEPNPHRFNFLYKIVEFFLFGANLLVHDMPNNDFDLKYMEEIADSSDRR